MAIVRASATLFPTAEAEADMTVRTLGIDPGANGCVSVITGLAPGGEVATYPLAGMTEHDISDVFRYLSVMPHIHAFLERVRAVYLPGEKAGIESSFRFGDSFGLLKGCLASFRIPYELVLPTAWQKEFKLVRTDKDESVTDKKNRHKAAAQRIFPAIGITHATADSLLIAEYGRRVLAKRFS